MQILNINIVPVFIAAFINMIVGSIWFSPVVCADRWLKLLGKTEKDIRKKKINSIYAAPAIAAVITAFVLAYFTLVIFIISLFIYALATT